jgi:negative regulator of genetic competence, sporulation and motility
VTIWVIGSYFFIEKEEINSKKKGNDDSSSSSSEEEEEDDETNTRTKEKQKEKEKNEEKSNDLIEKKETKAPNKKSYPKFYFFYKICSFAKGFKILYQKYDNSYYNEADLYFIIFFRFISLIFKVLYSNLNFIVHNPSKEINNTQLFNMTLT